MCVRTVNTGQLNKMAREKGPKFSFFFGKWGNLAENYFNTWFYFNFYVFARQGDKDRYPIYQFTPQMPVRAVAGQELGPQSGSRTWGLTARAINCHRKLELRAELKHEPRSSWHGMRMSYLLGQWSTPVEIFGICIVMACIDVEGGWRRKYREIYLWLNQAPHKQESIMDRLYSTVFFFAVVPLGW